MDLRCALGQGVQRFLHSDDSVGSHHLHQEGNYERWSVWHFCQLFSGFMSEKIYNDHKHILGCKKRCILQLQWLPSLSKHLNILQVSLKQAELQLIEKTQAPKRQCKLFGNNHHQCLACLMFPKQIQMSENPNQNNTTRAASFTAIPCLSNCRQLQR